MVCDKSPFCCLISPLDDCLGDYDREGGKGEARNDQREVGGWPGVQAESVHGPKGGVGDQSHHRLADTDHREDLARLSGVNQLTQLGPKKSRSNFSNGIIDQFHNLMLTVVTEFI